MRIIQGESRNDNPESTIQVLVAGPLFLDIVMGPLTNLPAPGQEIWVADNVFAAGGSANQAVGLARLGAKVSLRAYLGADIPGIMVKDLLKNESVDLSNLVQCDRQSVTVSLSVAQDRAMVTSGSDSCPPLTGCPRPDILVADLEVLRTNQNIVTQWRQQPNPTLVVADVGWDPTGEWNKEDLSPLNLADIFVPNADEAKNYMGTKSIEFAAEQLTQLVDQVVITMGAEGLLIAKANGTNKFLPSMSVPVKDPTGAGDAFSAGLVWGLANKGSLLQSASIGILTSGWSIQNLGGSVSTPTIKQLCGFLERNLPREVENESFDFSLLTDLCHSGKQQT